MPEKGLNRRQVTDQRHGNRPGNQRIGSDTNPGFNRKYVSGHHEDQINKRNPEE